MSDFYKINTFIFDVDGVLTDGSVLSYANGEHARRFYVKDGFAIEKAIQAGYNVIVISGGFEKGVYNRLTFLGVKDIFMGVKDKLEVFNSFKEEKTIDPSCILYMGDDIPDYKMLKLVGMPTCPNDAAYDIKEICKYVSPFDGGRGAVRDVIEKVMKAQGKWQKELW
ncbi:MAG: HAD hydrolase family protein [Cytophagaceae bacterium]|nr:HAD hydrolase family protein [Cytophagaceae bacterium]MDW8456561.1 HAD hydrolase family protein [Cytophagaceae bacterium]